MRISKVIVGKWKKSYIVVGDSHTLEWVIYVINVDFLTACVMHIILNLVDAQCIGCFT